VAVGEGVTVTVGSEVAVGAGVGVGVMVLVGVILGVGVGVGVKGRQGGAPIGMSPAAPKYTRVTPLAAQRPEASRKIAISAVVPA